jgi:hypothetical protein
MLTRAAVILAIAVPIGTAPASAQMFVATGRDTLRGLPGVEVEVEGLESDIERDGLTRAAIQADVAGQLRAGGITVYTSQRANASDAKAYVYVHVNSIRIPNQDVYAINLDVHLRQTLRSLVSPSNIVNAMTWDQSNVLVVPAGNVASVRAEIGRFVDQLIRDWRAVH